ncbi:MAG: transketolase [Candidatus Dojkabacteria bacterium]|nr:MAG: transketolase [Candidatus Dojkabacteria bacterium]
MINDLENTLLNYTDPNLAKLPTRDGFGQGLLEVAKQNSKIVGLCADLTESTRMHWFAENFRERFIQVGVAEQNLIGVAAGLALEGKIPFAASYAVFSPGRNWDQIRVSVCYSNLNVKIVGGHAGLTVGPDGATHQALEDIAITRVLPNLVVISPADSEQARQATIAIANYDGPCYLRLSREASPVFTTSKTTFEIGKAQVLKSGNDLTLIATGPMVFNALMVAENLKADYSVEVINVHTIKPIDIDTIVKSAQKTRKVVTVEEHQINGGLGGAVAEVLGEKYPTPMLRIGMNDCFGQSGKAQELLDFYGLSVYKILEKVKIFLNEKI